MSQSDSAELVRRKQINNQFCFYTVLAALFFIPYLCCIRNYDYVPFELLAVLLLALAFVFNHFGWLEFSMLWRFFVIAADVSYGALEMPGAGFEYFLIPLGLIPFILSDKTGLQLGLLSASLLLFFTHFFIFRHYRPHVLISEQNTTITYVLALTMVFVLCALFVIKFKIAGRNYEKVIQRQLVVIAEKNKDILDSINYASGIQKALLPSQEEFKRFIKNYFILYRPKDIVSGDFYWVELQDGKLYIAAADCTGHGVPGALVSVVCCNALTRSVKEFNINETGKILDKTRDLVLKTFEKSLKEVKDGMDISLLCIDTLHKKITWSGANNPLWYVRDGHLHEIKADKQPIGKSDVQKPFTTNQVEFKEGDIFYLFTDGLADQFGGPSGKKFKYKQLSDLLMGNYQLSLDEQSKLLGKALEDWQGHLEQVDDICVIGIKI